MYLIFTILEVFFAADSLTDNQYSKAHSLNGQNVLLHGVLNGIDVP